MPLLIVSDEDFDLTVASMEKAEGRIAAKIINKNHGGRHPGNKNVPEVLRNILVEESITSGATDKEIGAAFGLGPHILQAYGNGATSLATYSQPNEKLMNHVNLVKNRIHKKARNRLVLALDHITKEKLADCKPRDLASVANDMSKIIEKMEPRIAPSMINNIILYAPTQVKESNFEVIDVTSNL